jgi:thymidylate synthase (FAD)
MKQVTPRVYMVAATAVHLDNMKQMLNDLGVKDWESDAKSDGELLTEVGGRLCYKSFNTELNKNLSRVREGNLPYIGNILKSKHGSVLEHATVTFVFLNVSRIFTHELCRHRAGTAFSQESMRFVRLDDIPIYVPDLTADFEELSEFASPGGSEEDNKTWAVDAMRLFREKITILATRAEETIQEFSYYLDKPEVPFSLKKRITSALRRMAPGGHTTNIMVTANHRAWRHMIEMRTSPGAEEEIQKVFLEVMNHLHKAFPAIYQDTKQTAEGQIVFEHSKI